MSIFEWLYIQPENFTTFRLEMPMLFERRRLLGTHCRYEVRSSQCRTCFFLSLEEYGHIQKLEKDVLLVDVGGSRGRLLERFRQQRPDCLARMVVQDLPNMIEGRVHDTRFFHTVIYQWSVLSHLAYPVLQEHKSKVHTHTYTFRHIFPTGLIRPVSPS